MDELSTAEKFCALGQKDLALSMIGNYGRDLQMACNRGYKNLARLILETFYIHLGDLNNALYQACDEGHTDLVLLMIEKGANHFDWALCGACSSGHIDLVRLMIEKGASKIYFGIRNACDKKRKDIILLLIDKGLITATEGLHFASKSRYKELVLLLIEKGADIEMCCINLDEYDIDYLLFKKVKDFGRFKEIADLCMERRGLADQIFKELNLRDVNTVILSY